MSPCARRLQPILDMLASRAWRGAARDQDGELLLLKRSGLERESVDLWQIPGG